MPEILNPFILNKIKKNLIKHETKKLAQKSDTLQKQNIELLHEKIDEIYIKKILTTNKQKENYSNGFLKLMNLLTISEFDKEMR